MTSKAKIILAICLAVVAAAASEARAAERCNFTRDLSLGDAGEDVRCLQQFLNSAGFTIAESGAGSPGRETTTFRERTLEAVKRWQEAKNISPATGTFGPVSRGTYETQTTVSSTPTPAPVPAPTTSSATELTSALERQVRQLIKQAHDLLEDARDDIDDAQDDGKNTSVAVKLADKAEEKLIDSLYAFIDDDFSEASTLADRALGYAKDSREEIIGDGSDAEDAIDDASEAIADARDEINDADDNDEDVDEAKDILDEAKEKLKQAREYFDDGDYDKAVRQADRAQELANDAVDAIN